jgi:hypothetical protein
MKSEGNRREFMKDCAAMGGCCLAVLLGAKTLSGRTVAGGGDAKETEAVDPKSLAYCGLSCGTQCALYKATVENDVALKKKVYEAWGWKEKFKVEFDPEKVFCWGCKPADKPLKVGMDACDVRNCAIGKKLEACVQCGDLKTCDRELWKEWPAMKENALKLQAAFAERKAP